MENNRVYDEFESLIYGPIDELYRNAQAARGTTDISDLPGAYAYTGDIAQKHNGGTWRHSMIVTKFSGGQVYVTGRTSPYSNNDDILVRELHIPANKIGMPSAMPL